MFFLHVKMFCTWTAANLSQMYQSVFGYDHFASVTGLFDLDVLLRNYSLTDIELPSLTL